MYKIRFKKTAEKDLLSLPKVTVKRISAVIDDLAEDPRPTGSKKLKASKENLWRLRIGDYRVVYLIEDKIQIVEVRKVGHRSDIYDNF